MCKTALTFLPGIVKKAHDILNKLFFVVVRQLGDTLSHPCPYKYSRISLSMLVYRKLPLISPHSPKSGHKWSKVARV